MLACSTNHFTGAALNSIAGKNWVQGDPRKGPTHKQYQQHIHSMPNEKYSSDWKNLTTTIFDYLTTFYFDIFVRIDDQFSGNGDLTKTEETSECTQEAILLYQSQGGVIVSSREQTLATPPPRMRHAL